MGQRPGTGETARLGKADSTFGCCVLPSPRGALAHASRSSVHSQVPVLRPKLYFLLVLDCKTQPAAHAGGTSHLGFYLPSTPEVSMKLLLAVGARGLPMADAGLWTLQISWAQAEATRDQWWGQQDEKLDTGAWG